MANLQLPGGDAPGVDMVDVLWEIPSIRCYMYVQSADGQEMPRLALHAAWLKFVIEVAHNLLTTL